MGGGRPRGRTVEPPASDFQGNPHYPTNAMPAAHLPVRHHTCPPNRLSPLSRLEKDLRTLSVKARQLYHSMHACMACRAEQTPSIALLPGPSRPPITLILMTSPRLTYLATPRLVGMRPRNVGFSASLLTDLLSMPASSFPCLSFL